MKIQKNRTTLVEHSRSDTENKREGLKEGLGRVHIKKPR